MKEMWTGIYPNKKEYKYEIRFRTDDKSAYKFVEEACRNAIDIDWRNKEKSDQETKKSSKFRWLIIGNTVYEIAKEPPVIEIECKCGYITHKFNIKEMIDGWNTTGIFTCGECGRKITYEFRE